MDYSHEGGCHCGAIGITLRTTRCPHDQVLGACQCGFCRKHNARAFSDPDARVTLVAHEPEHLQRYSFGLQTAEAVICRRCGVYVAMVLIEEDRAWSTVNIDALKERALFTRPVEPRDFTAEDAVGRTARRKARWSPTTLVDWPETIERLRGG
jgi:hypothetical protein